MLPEEPTLSQDGPLTLLKVYGADPPLTPLVTLTVEIPVYILPAGISKPMLLKLKDEDEEPPPEGGVTGVVGGGVVVEGDEPTCPTLMVILRDTPSASVT